MVLVHVICILSHAGKPLVLLDFFFPLWNQLLLQKHRAYMIILPTPRLYVAFARPNLPIMMSATGCQYQGKEHRLIGV